MLTLDPRRLGAMNHPSGAAFPNGLPIKTEDPGFPFQEFPADGPPPGQRPDVPNVSGVANYMQPTTCQPGMFTGYPMTETPVNMLGLNNGGMEFLHLDPLIQNTPSGGGGTTPEEGLSINFNISPFIESPRPTDDPDLGNPPLSQQQQQQQQQQHHQSPLPPEGPLQGPLHGPFHGPLQVPLQGPPQGPPHMQPQIPFHPQWRPPYGIPISTTDRMNFDRFRRNSAPELNLHGQELSLHEQERRTKHASRRASHNVVEKRYRLNLNEKFRKLDEIVVAGMDPSFVPDTANAHGSSNSANSNSDGAASAPVSTNRTQPPKATVIDRALTYIDVLQREVCELRQRLAVYEKGGVPLQPLGRALPTPAAGIGSGDAQDFTDEHDYDPYESSSVKSESPFN
ncbi:hypothetical protein BJY00DRAFT_79437 [Aspergillus carlsbadensis]|nr:hypothetical protein BJY00DRAFT_79437 [Aspergillus carlsbadensis]